MINEVRGRSLEQFGELLRHEGDKFAYVLEGTVIVHTDVYAPAVLQRGMRSISTAASITRI
jgi:hypothetical protein